MSFTVEREIFCRSVLRRRAGALTTERRENTEQASHGSLQRVFAKSAELATRPRAQRERDKETLCIGVTTKRPL